MRQFFDGPARPQNAKRRRRTATAVVEFAVVVPVLVLLMMGQFELSRGMMVRQVLCGAARKGCRTGILKQYGSQDIINDASNVLQDNGFGPTKFNPPTIGQITIQVTDPSGNTLADALDAPSGSTVSVQVTIPASSIDWATSYFLTNSMLVSDTVVMMKQ
jgi:Flp pilus assembly protein TadG